MPYRATAILPAICVLIGAFEAAAGGGPQNVLIVVNEASPQSMAVGNYYREKRGIHPSQVLGINIATHFTINTANFSNQVLNPILTSIAASGLRNQIDYMVFSRDIPSRVQLGNGETNVNSITSAMFYGYQFSFAPCTLPAYTRSDYYESETAFTRSGAPSSNRYYMATMLTAWDPDQNRRLIDRAMAADSSTPTGGVYYLVTADTSRNIRWTQSDRSIYLKHFLDPAPFSRFVRGEWIAGQTNVTGYLTGPIDGVVNNIQSNHYAPGALADHLTSFGGFLFDSLQTSILDWIAAGAGGTYGTVVEPCAITNKFPQARLHFWYARGFNLGESYYMSVQNPYQGIVLGDPLTAAYAAPPVAQVDGLTPNSVVTGLVDITVTGIAASAERSVDQIDLFLNDRYVATLTNVSLQAGDIISAQVDAHNRSYTILSGDTLADAARGLANAVNDTPPTIHVTAAAFSDRVELYRKSPYGVSGSNVAYSATSTNSPGAPTIFAHTPGTHLADTVVPARQDITLSGTVSTGDQIVAVIKRLDGVAFTNTVTSTSTNDTRFSLMNTLRHLILGTPGLQDSTGAEVVNVRNITGAVEMSIRARTNTWDTYNMEIDFQSSGAGLTGSYTGKLTSNADVMGARGMIFLRKGFAQLTASYSLDTTALADGRHSLRVVAYEGSALRTQGHAVIPFTVSNHNGHCVITVPEHGASLESDSIVTAWVDTALSPGTVTSVQFFVHGKLLSETNAPPWQFEWDTAAQGAGLIDLQARARGDSGEEIASRVHTIRVTLDTDGDGIPDWWAYKHFGGITNVIAGADDDGDGASNLHEYIAGTDPLDEISVFRITNIGKSITNDWIQFDFSSTTSRLYNVDYRDADLSQPGDWFPVDPALFRGQDLSTTWVGTNAPAMTTNFLRYFRVWVRIP